MDRFMYHTCVHIMSGQTDHQNAPVDPSCPDSSRKLLSSV